MDVRNCPRCGKLFTYMSSPICKDCEKAEEETFRIVKEYIDNNPHCTMNDIVQETGVAAKKITRYIKDGRIEISRGMVGEITCEGCGKPIPRGRYCDKCFIKINHEVKDMFSPTTNERAKTGPKMHHTKRL